MIKQAIFLLFLIFISLLVYYRYKSLSKPPQQIKEGIRIIISIVVGGIIGSVCIILFINNGIEAVYFFSMALISIFVPLVLHFINKMNLLHENQD